MSQFDLSPQMMSVLMQCSENEDGRVPVELLVKHAASVGRSIASARSSTSRRVHKLAGRQLVRLEPPRRATTVELTNAGWDVVSDRLLNGDGVIVNTPVNGDRQTTKPLPWWRRLFGSDE